MDQERLTRDELRIRVAEKMGWTDIRPDGCGGWVGHDKHGEAWLPLPALDHWAWGFVMDLGRKDYYLFLSVKWEVRLDLGAGDYAVQAEDADPAVAVCTAWLAACAKGDDK